MEVDGVAESLSVAGRPAEARALRFTGKDTAINAARGRLPGRSREPTTSSARRSACKNASRRRPLARGRLRASVGRARRARPDATRPRERRRVAIDHPRSRVRLETPPVVPLLHRRHRRDVPVRGPRPNGVYRRTLAPGWSRGAPEASGAASQPSFDYVTEPPLREYQRHHAQRYANGIAPPISDGCGSSS